MSRKGETQVKMTPARKDAFLAALRASGGIFSEACRRCSPHSTTAGKTPPCYSSFRALMTRDMEFNAAVAEVMDQVRDDIEQEIHRRGYEGWVEPVIQKGTQATLADGSPAYIRRFDSSLLKARATAMMPDRYGDNRHVRHDVVHSGQVTHKAGLSMAEIRNLSPEELDQVEAAYQLIDRVQQDQKAIEHNPPEIIDADFEPVEEDTLAVLERLEAEGG